MRKVYLAVSAVSLYFAAAVSVNAQSALEPQTGNPAADLMQTFRDYGINLRGQVINETADSRTGGIHQGSINTGQIQLGADFDLERMLNIPGASLHVTGYRDYGASISARDIGNGSAIRSQEIFKNPFNELHFGLFTYEQKLFDDKLDIVVGRTSTAAYFAHLDLACRFMSGADCGIPGLVNSQSGFSLLPSGTWGGKVSYQFTPEFYAMTGVFEVNPTTQMTDGFNFSTEKSTGVTVPVEFGYGVKDGPYPYDVKLGAYYSDGAHADPYFNTAHRSLGTSGGKAQNIQDRSGMYLLGEKTVWRAGDGSPSNVALLGGYVQPFDEKTEIYAAQVYGGAVWTGPFASRPKDWIGFVANYFRVSDEEIDFLHDARAKAGGHGTNSPNEFLLELDYGFSVMPGVKVMPDLQYIINPDNSAIPRTKILPSDAWVVGLKAEVQLGELPFLIP